MTLHERNRMLHILHKKNVSRDHITKIMDDLGQSGIFDEEEICEEDWETTDLKASILFSDMDPEEKLREIKYINSSRTETTINDKRNKFFCDSEKRIQAKIKEMEEKGLVGFEGDKSEEKERKNRDIKTRYGRNPLHEAVSMRDLTLVKKYVKEGLYLDEIDNNGHTPKEKAYYEGFKEALVVFNTIIKNEK